MVESSERASLLRYRWSDHSGVSELAGGPCQLAMVIAERAGTWPEETRLPAWTPRKRSGPSMPWTSRPSIGLTFSPAMQSIFWDQLRLWPEQTITSVGRSDDSKFCHERPWIPKQRSSRRMKRANAFIGSPIERIEDLRFVRGRGKFVDDLNFDGQWHGAVVRTAVPHGRIRNIDTSVALQMPGVQAVITAKDIDSPIPKVPFRRPNPVFAAYAQPVIADGFVRYVGEPIAFILAETSLVAEDAIAAVAADIEHLPVVVDRKASA